MHLRQNHDDTPSSAKTDVDWIVLTANAIGIVIVVLAAFYADPVKTAANDNGIIVSSNTF